MEVEFRYQSARTPRRRLEAAVAVRDGWMKIERQLIAAAAFLIEYSGFAESAGEFGAVVFCVPDRCRGRKATRTAPPATPRHVAMSWARRLKRVFGIEIQDCARCGGALRIIASLEEPQVVGRILSHLERMAPEQYPPALPLGARALLWTLPFYDTLRSPSAHKSPNDLPSRKSPSPSRRMSRRVFGRCAPIHRYSRRDGNLARILRRSPAIPATPALSPNAHAVYAGAEG